MKFIQKNLFFLILLLILACIYFLIRLPHLTLQPIFADEAIYIRWAQVMRAEATLRFLPLSDGKTPLFMWAMIPLFKIFKDPLFAGRILSIFSGFMTFLGVIFLGWRFFNKTTAFFAGLLIVITPMIFFFDRMALVDSMLSAFSIWALNLSLLLIIYQRIDLAMLLGYILGGSLLTKPPGFFNLIAMPSSLFLLNWRSKNRQTQLLKIFGLWIIVTVITLIIYNILRLGPGFSNLNSRNQDYVFSPTILTYRPLDPFIPHFNDLVDWLPKILTIPTLLLIILGAFFALIKRNKVPIAILLWGLIPFLIEMALLRTFTARYILFSFPPFLVTAAWFLNEIIKMVRFKKTFVFTAVLLVLLPQALYFDYLLLTDLASAPLPKEERIGYLEEWTAGYGLKEIAQFLDAESKKGEVVVGTEGAFGTLPDGLAIYLDKNRQVIVIGGSNFISDQIRNSAKDRSTYFVANHSRYKYYEKNLQLIKEYPKISGNLKEPDSILLFKVLPDSTASASGKLNK